EKDAGMEWSPGLVELLATLPAAEYRPLFRKQWSDFSLRDAILRHLLVNPEEADRERFLDGLESVQQDMALACVRALRSLPRDKSPKNLVPIMRCIRSASRTGRFLRESLIDLLNYQAGTAFPVGHTKELNTKAELLDPFTD